MRIAATVCLSLSLAVGIALTGCDSESVKLTSSKDSTSYAMGAQVGKSINESKFDVDPEIIAKAVVDVMNGSQAIPDSVIAQLMFKLQEQRRGAQQAEDEAKAKGTIKAGKDFLEANKSKPGVVATASGLQYKVIKAGTGAKPQATSTVRIHYVGTLIDGTEFDNSIKRGQPAEFPVNGVIPGFAEALSLMSVGAKHMVYIPHELAYGLQQAGTIPPGSVLVFEIEMLGIK
jgi:FKBP-type peptidyl-prolyl cis-trans isomerase FkpA/FKBP-type peptidyl-prolyl cis-trans isomerase FklB